jgi:ATP synthase protein I
MARIVLLQMATALVVALLAGILVTLHWLSAFIGGMCCSLPNAFLRYACSWAPKNLVEQTDDIFIGEFIKIALTIALMAAVVYWYRDVN